MIEELRAEIEQLKRRGRAPFSKGIRKTDPKPPGRKPGHRMVQEATEWEWSRARAHCDAGVNDPLLAPGWQGYFGGWNHGEWGEPLRQNEEDEGGRNCVAPRSRVRRWGLRSL